MMALLLCTGFIVTQPISVMAEEIMIFAQTAQQQKQSVSGVIKDATGEPVIGASVLEKGTTNGTITDFDGRFTLNVIPGTTLIISYIGYKTVEMKIVAGQPINLTLTEDSEMLEEVVVVGYGTMRKKDLTGSVVQINPSKIADQNPTSVQDVLRGTPGLQIGYDASAKGSDASILLRGQNSLGTNASPMIVLDGMAFYGELSEINPDDIAQIDVLKDASSAAIYGAKAAAGVIIITTKKGKEGKPVINVGRREMPMLGCTRLIDLKRLNREPEFAKTIVHEVNGVEYKLETNSPKYILPIPPTVLRFNPDMIPNIR